MNKPYALITGASGGIGRALCDEFARDGTPLILVARSGDKLAEAKRLLEASYGIDVIILEANLSRATEVERITQTITDQNLTVGYMVNNAGFGDFGQVVETEWQRLNDMIQLNVAALTQLSRHYAAEFKAQGSGKILNVASTAAFVSGPGMSVYFASKAYVLSFSTALNEELRGSGVSVTTLCPGPTESGFAHSARATKTSAFRGKLPSSQAVAAFGYQAMQQGKPLVIHGIRNRIMINVVQLIPRQFVTRRMARMQA